MGVSDGGRAGPSQKTAGRLVGHVMSKTAVGTPAGIDLIGNARRARIKDDLIYRFIFANGAIAIVAIFLIFVFLAKDAAPIVKHVNAWEFLSGRAWQPEFEVFGILPLLAGSFFVTFGAVLIAVPVGIACAIYLAEVAPKWVREILKPTIEVLAGIPSVVIGFIGLTMAAPVIQRLLDLPTGLTALTGSIMLAFMSMPTIITIAEDAIVAVPKAYRDGSMALGATHWETIRGVVVPAAKSGIVAACMLGVGRAIGETMTVLMVAGNASVVPEGMQGIWKFFTGPVRTMTATIAGDMGETVRNSPHYHSLFAVGLVLFAITFLINLVADIALKRTKY
jgi:phosphate transport system permease protein